MSEPIYHTRPIGDLSTHDCMIGTGQPVLLLHGWGGSHESMLPVAKKLAESGYACYVPDLPGFGKTERPHQTWGVPDYAQWVIDYLNANNLERVFLIGHSFGGRISLILGADYPDRIHKIALSNAAGVKFPPSLKQRFLLFGKNSLMLLLSLPFLSRYKPRVRAKLRARFSSDDYLTAGELQDIFLAVVNQNLLPYARRMQPSTLLFWGDQDQETPLKMGRLLEKTIPDAALIVYNGVGHFAYLDQLPQFIRVVTHFFSTSNKGDLSA